MHSFQKNGKTYNVIYALRHECYESLAIDLTQRSNIEGSKVNELIKSIGNLRGQRLEGIIKPSVKPLYNENGTLKRSLEEMKRYNDSLCFALTSRLTLTIYNILKIHSRLFDDKVKDRGILKVKSNDLTLPCEDPNTKFIIATTPPEETQTELGYLIRWTNHNLKSKNLHPLIVISTFIYEFLFIHPFEDGNGRTSRILTQMLLLNAGFNFAAYTSIDDVIQNDRWIHSDVLLKEASNRNADCLIKLDLWIRYYLITIGMMTNQRL